MSGSDDDDTTHQGKRPPPPQVPTPIPDRPTLPHVGRVATRKGVKARHDDGELIDDGPTMFDPSVPTGASGFDPGASGEQTGKRAPRPGTGPSVILDDEPTGAKAPLATVIGKRAGGRATPDPRELPTMKHKPPPKVDESAHTNEWDPDDDLDDAAPHRDSGPATNPLPNRAPEAARQRANSPTAPLPGRVKQPTPGRVPQPTPGRQLPLAPGPRSAPLRVVSMKTPQPAEEDKSIRPLPEVKIRAISELNQAPARGMGHLAPPRDPTEARSRRRRELVIWGSVAVIVAAVVTLVVWFLAR